MNQKEKLAPNKNQVIAFQTLRRTPRLKKWQRAREWAYRNDVALPDLNQLKLMLMSESQGLG
ncbi:MAG: hypothetical protein MK135_03320 [Polyangiaceae bacterium]|nr:hypothetical protein [Polyangiaceae bacterium]